MVGISVPGKLWSTTPPHQLAMGVKASLILSSNPCSCARRCVVGESRSEKIVAKNKSVSYFNVGWSA